MDHRHWRGLSVILLVVGASRVFAQSDLKVDADPPVPTQGQIIFRAGWAPARAAGFPGCETYLRSASPNKGGVLEAFGVQAWMIPRLTLWVVVDYPRLRVDDIAPVLGQLSRVAEIHDRGQPKGSKGKDWMMMAKVEENRLPPGLSFNQRSIVVPLNHDGLGSTMFDVGQTRVLVMKIEPAADGDKGGPVAEIRLYDSAKNPPDSILKLRRGDTLPVRDARYKVLNVVPRDEKTHVIGWIELAP